MPLPLNTLAPGERKSQGEGEGERGGGAEGVGRGGGERGGEGEGGSIRFDGVAM